MWGWEPRTFTTYEYDGDRLVGTVTTTEPEFDAEQADLLRAYMRLKDDIGPHGHPMTEATSADANPSKVGGHKYEASPTPAVDYAAKALADAQDAYYKKWPDASRNGHLWSVRKVQSEPENSGQ